MESFCEVEANKGKCFNVNIVIKYSLVFRLSQ